MVRRNARKGVGKKVSFLLKVRATPHGNVVNHLSSLTAKVVENPKNIQYVFNPKNSMFLTLGSKWLRGNFLNRRGFGTKATLVVNGI